ncbi:response regulator transcription factor [soil metagenome]
MTQPIRVLVVDDQALVRTGFRMIVDAEDGLEVVGEAADGFEAVDAVRRLHPDVVLMDIRMPRMDGIEATAAITSLVADPLGDAPDERPVRVLVVTTFDLDEHVYDALRHGASGFLLKDTPPEDLVRAIRVVAAGDALLGPSATRVLVEAFTGSRAAAAPTTAHTEALDRLTDREREVLLLVAGGRTNAEIAKDLVVSETTVKTHVGRIFAKLHLRDRVQAVVLAYECGLVVPGAPASGSSSGMTG